MKLSLYVLLPGCFLPGSSVLRTAGHADAVVVGSAGRTHGEPWYVSTASVAPLNETVTSEGVASVVPSVGSSGSQNDSARIEPCPRPRMAG